MANAANAANLDIDTTQPKPLVGLIIRGNKEVKEVICKQKGAGKDGEDRFIKVPEDQYDKKIHGERVDALPVRKKTAKKTSAKKEAEKEE